MSHADGLMQLIKQSVAMILAGGQGQRLYPLTRRCAKPALRFGATYRMIDFTLSNCVNSNLKRIHLLTQYAASSLHRHVRRGWTHLFAEALDEFIDLVPPQKIFADRWYAGTADAIYQNLFILQDERPARVFLLSGDHVYKMDYSRLLAFHESQQADVTLACVPVPRERCTQLGVVECEQQWRIIGFEEKPDAPKPMPGNTDYALASMGVYLWNTEVLARQVAEDATADSSHDFGQDVIPRMIEQGLSVFAHNFCDPHSGQPAYWRDIGTISGYWEANMDLAAGLPELDLYDPQWPIYSDRSQYPPAKTVHGAQTDLRDSLVAPGCIISGATVNHSILSPGVRIAQHAQVTESILMDDVQVGEGARLHKVIIDEGVTIPADYEIGVNPESDKKRFVVTEDGITVVPGGVILD